jgi:hypothetical protein
LIGGLAALAAGLVFRRNLAAEYWLAKSFGLFAAGPAAAPATALDWFSLIRDGRGYALVLLGLGDLVDYLLVGLMYLGLRSRLRPVDRGLAAAAWACVLVGLAVYLAANQIFPLLYLGDRYFRVAATGDASGGAALLAAGEALLAVRAATVDYGYGMNPPYVLVTLGGLLFALAMRRSGDFGRATPLVGLAATGIGLGFVVTAIAAPAWSVLPIAGSAPFLMAWYIMVGIRMIKSSIGPAANAGAK